MKALLFSGGVDSAALAYWLRPDVLLTIDYGQRVASGELRASSIVAHELSLRHEIVRVDCSHLGLGNLAGRSPSSFAPSPEWWPYRNQLLITIAGLRLIPDGLTQLMIGTVSTDVTHADGRPEFLAAIDRVMQVQEGEVRVTAPARGLSSGELVSSSGIPIELLGWTFSCHLTDPPCGQCRGCQKHLQATETAFRARLG